MEILSPIGRIPGSPAQASSASARVADIRGKKVAFLNNGWPAMRPIIDQMRRRLLDDYGADAVFEEAAPISNAAPPELLDRIAERADVAVVGLAT